jgi:hypothetical protein
MPRLKTNAERRPRPDCGRSCHRVINGRRAGARAVPADKRFLDQAASVNKRL